MRQQNSPFARFLYFLLGVFLILAGVWLALTLFEAILAVNFGVFVDVRPLQNLVAIAILSVACYIGVVSGVIQEFGRSVQGWLLGTGSTSAIATDATPTTFARFQYKLDVPDESDQFDQYLDTPLFPTKTNHYLLSPAELVEKVMLQLSSDLQKQYGSKLLIETKVTRGSLDLFMGLTVVVNAVQLLAMYHDLVESTVLMGRHLNQVVDSIKGGYAKQSDKLVRVSGGMEVVAQPMHPPGSDDLTPSVQGGTAGGTPVTVTNSYVPPQSAKDLNVSLNISGQHPSVWGCINSCLLTLLVLISGVAFFLMLFVDYEARLSMLNSIMAEASNSLQAVGEWLVSLGEYISPY